MTLDRAVSAIRTHYANQIRTIEAIGGRIPHAVIIVWTGHELKVRIAGTDDLGSIRPNLHGPLYGAHSPFADTFNYNSCRKAAKRLGKLNKYFQGVIVMFAGCAQTFHLDVPGVNGDIDNISDGRSTYVKHVAEIMKIMQASGVTCFPCSSPDGFLGTLFRKFRKDDTPYGRIHLQPHPAMAAELAQFFQDVVLYVTTQCMIESLTLGPRECRLPLNEMSELNKTPWMNYWRQSRQNR